MDRVRDWMTAHPEVVPAEASLGECARRMAMLSVRHLPVVDGAGTLLGVVTDASIFQRGRLQGADARWIPWIADDELLHAGEVAESLDVAVSPDEALSVALDRLTRSEQDVLVAVDEAERPVGVLTEHDGVRYARERLPPDLHARGKPGLVTVRPDDSAIHAWQLMQTRRIRHLLVLQDDALVGVISWRDLVRESVPRGRDITCREVSGGRDVHTTPEGTPLVDVADQMLAKRIGCVPLMDGERVSGVLTRVDLIRKAIA